MDIKLEILNKDEWAVLSEDAHFAVFKERRGSYFDRIDYAMLAVKDDRTILGYATVRELDSESVYWQYGGAFASIRGGAISYRVYEQFIDYTRRRYKRVSTLVENSNVVYLKMAMKMGFRIIGTRTFKTKILVELLLEFDDAV